MDAFYVIFLATSLPYTIPPGTQPVDNMTSSTSANILPFGERVRAFERRRHRRDGAPHVRAQPDGHRLEIIDMSPQGMAIETPYPFAAGTTYLFELFDQGRSLMVEGEIRWCRRQLPGVASGISAEGSVLFRTGVSFVGIHLRSQPAPAIPALGTAVSEAQALDVKDAEELTRDRLGRLARAENPDDAAELLLDLLSADFEHLVLFRIRDGQIGAWLGRGPTLVPDRLMKLRLAVEQASVFLHLREGGSFYYGMLPAMFADLRLLGCWDGNLDRECVLFPIRLRGRLVAVLYADTGSRPLTPEHLGGLQAATALFTRSLVDQILRRKNRTSLTGCN